MALATKTSVGDGVTAGPYTFSFAYLKDAYIHCYLDGVETALFTLSTGSVTFDTAPADGAVITIQRETVDTARLVDFQGGSTMTEANMDLDSDQIFHLLQERIDALVSSLTVGTDNKIDATSHIIKNVTDAVDAQDAVTKSQLDDAVLASGNVPAPANPTDDDKVLTASAGAFGWTAPAAADPVTIADITDAGTVGKAILADTTAAAVRTEIGVEANPMTTEGDMIRGAAGGGAMERFPIGTNGTYLKSNGTTAVWDTVAGGGGDFTLQVFTTGGTYTRPAGLVAAEVWVVGGGGGGGGSTTTNNRAGGGGGAGGVSMRALTATEVTASQTVTVGAAGTGGTGSGLGGNGGNSSFGTLAVGNGGTGGPGGGTYAAGGVGGTATTGDINVTGGQGSFASPDISLTTADGLAKLIGGFYRGGEAAFGFSARAAAGINRNTTPSAPIGFGGGGDGNIRVSSSSTGGVGGAGIVIVKEFY